MANNRMGSIYKAQEKYSLAIEHFKIALSAEDNETNAQVQYDIAESYEKNGEEGAAIEEYLKVGYRYPGGKFWVARADYKCAELLEKGGEMDRARKLYEKLAGGDSKESELARQKLLLQKRLYR